jgi:cellulose synthase/poly-beta-1,6-N-acetylglucosamine synthase-like glycosyltransferase
VIAITWFFFLYLIIPLATILVIFIREEQYPVQFQGTDFPKVSVLVAARNEEKNILTCLQALEQLDYPKEKLQILIGNDSSEDNTASFVEHFIKDKSNYKLFHITRGLGSARAKANVLAQLAHEASGDFFFYTDADIQVSRQWVKSMLAACDEHTGIINGVTLIDGERFFDKMQAIDWCFGLAMIKVLEFFRIPVSAMGNNMMLRREAYFATGGYENMPATIIEDLAIFRQIVSRGWKFRQLYHESVKAQSKPVSSIIEWMHQRKRWLKGAMQLPWYLRSILVIQVLIYPVLLVLLFIYPCPVFMILFSRFIMQWLIIIKSLQKLKKPELLKYSVFYEFYSLFLYAALVVFYFLPVQTSWKGRKYT